MKLLAVSDSHGQTGILEELARLHGGGQSLLVHCGDSELPAGHEAISPFRTVRGNCDFDTGFPETLTIKSEAKTIFVTHGHVHNVKMSLLHLSYAAKEEGADIVLFGHSHLPGAEMVDGTLFLNPGSISLPRGGHERTYAIIETSGSLISVRYYGENHNEIERMNCEFTLS